jgi:hypothetical protein
MVQNEPVLKTTEGTQFIQYQLPLQLTKIPIIIIMMEAIVKNLYCLNVEMPYLELLYR